MRVLIADHGSDVVDYLKQIVEDLGHDAVGCTDSKTFTEILLGEHLTLSSWIGIFAQQTKTRSLNG
jgi:hypothetical protein